MQTRLTDILIVGTGFGAAAPALRLARAGFKITMIEKGPHINPFRDFRQTQDPRYLLRYLHSLEGDHLGLTYAEALGGASGFYEMVSLRAPSMVFGLTDGGGANLWPAGVDRRALDPYYDIADEMLHVEQIAAEDVPKSGLVFARMMKNLGYSCERARYAVRGCLGSGFCVSGCVYGAKQSLLVTYLPQIVEAGGTIETDLDAVSVRPLGRVQETPPGGAVRSVPHRYEVVCRHARTGQLRRYRARVLILGGGALGTARLLLASREQLPLLSDQVGLNIAFNGSVKAAGLMPLAFPAGDMFKGRTHPGMISYQFLASHGISIAAAKALPINIVAAAQLRLEGDSREPAWWGQANTELMKVLRHRVMALLALGLTPPLAQLVYQPGGRLEVRLPMTEELRRYRREALELLHSIMRRNGFRIIEAESRGPEGEAAPDHFFSTAHFVGSCRMADSKARGVVDAAGEVFDYPGLFVSDGATIPSSLAVNTSLTILANAERIAAGITRRYTAGRDRISINARSRRSPARPARLTAA